VYENVNKNKTQLSFAYYPHFWLPTNHRPTFKKVLYQLIKRCVKQFPQPAFQHKT